MACRRKTCRALFKDNNEQWCRACIRRRPAAACVRRREQNTSITPVNLSPRKRVKRNYFSNFADKDDVNDYLADAELEKYVWFMPQHMGGRRRSKRSTTKLIFREMNMAEEFINNSLKLNEICQGLAKSVCRLTSTTTTAKSTTEISSNTTTTPPGPDTPRQPTTPPQQITPPNFATSTTTLPQQQSQMQIYQRVRQQLTAPTTQIQMKPAKVRRYIQFVYEMLGCPPEQFPDGTTCWDSKDGVINKIKSILGLNSRRSRLQIRRVLQYIRDCLDQGILDFDAGQCVCII